MFSLRRLGECGLDGLCSRGVTTLARRLVDPSLVIGGFRLKLLRRDRFVPSRDRESRQ
jgi:hypothetical protein